VCKPIPERLLLVERGFPGCAFGLLLALGGLTLVVLESLLPAALLACWHQPDLAALGLNHAGLRFFQKGACSRPAKMDVFAVCSTLIVPAACACVRCRFQAPFEL